MRAHLETLSACPGSRPVCQACVGATSALDCNLNGYEDDCSAMNDVSCRSFPHLKLIYSTESNAKQNVFDVLCERITPLTTFIN